MNFKNLSGYYAWGIKALIFVIPFLSFWISKSMFFPYITGRNFAFRILVEIGIVLWFGLVFLSKEYRPKLTPIFTAILIFVGVVGLADVLGVDFYHSFWSRFERMEGYLMILHLFAYFILLTAVLRTKKDWFVFFNLFVFAGILVGGYGVLQILGIKEAIQGGDVRIDGTIGNPTYLAAYILLINSLVLILLFNAKKIGWKYFYGLILAFNLFITYFAASRGVTLAMFVAIPIFLVLYIVLVRKKPEEVRYRKIAFVALLAIFIIPIVFSLVKNQQWVKDSNVLSRFAAISLNEKTTRSRFLIWNISIQGFKERPILGWGQENYLQVFSKHYNPRLYDQEPWFDRSHNIVLDWLINAGLIGLISYIAIFVVLFRLVWQLIAQNKVSLKEGLILLVAPVAYFFQNLFVFDNFNTYIIFFALLAYVDYLHRCQSEVIPAIDDRQMPRSIIALVCAALAIAPVIYFANIRPIGQARGIINGLIATTTTPDPVGATLQSFKNAVSYNTFGKTETLEQLGRVAKLLLDNSSIPVDSKLELVKYAVAELEEYLKEFPNDIRIHLFAGDIYQTLSSSVNVGFLINARDHFKAASDLSPKKQQIIFALANNYLSNGEIEKAIELSQQAVILEPSNLEAQANTVILLILAKHNDLAQKVMEDMNKIMLGSEAEKNIVLSNYSAQMRRIAGVLVRYSQFSNARKIYQHLSELSPGDENIAKALSDLQGK